MEGHFLWNIAGTGFWVLLLITGFLALVLPGRYMSLEAERVGLGRHVEAVLLVSLIITIAMGTNTHVPVFVGPGGVLAVSLLGAVVPTILGVYFLVAAGWKRLLLSLIPLAVVSIAAYATSEPVADMGIIARPPYYFIPALLGAAGALIVGWRTLHAIPLAYAYGSLGALIGADMLRIQWILETPLTAASIGGADALDLVFLMGLWSAAFAAIPYAPRFLRLRHKEDAWSHIAQLAHKREAEQALERAEALVRTRLDEWTRDRGLQAWDETAILHESTAGPVLQQLHELRASPRPWEPAAVKQVLENLAGLEHRLRERPIKNIAPRGDRLLAGLIDLVPILIVAGLAVVAAFFIPLAPRPGEPELLFQERRFLAGMILVLWSTIATHVLYPLFAEWFTNGRTLGKAIMGLQVRYKDGSRPTGWSYFVRNLTRLLDLLLLYLIPFVSSRESGRERLGDYFAGTYICTTRTTNIQSDTPNPTAIPTSESQWSLETTRAPR